MQIFRPGGFIVNSHLSFPISWLQFTMATSIPRAMPSRPSYRALPIGRPRIFRQYSSQGQNWAGHPFDVAKDNVAQLAASPRRPLTLADLLKSVLDIQLAPKLNQSVLN